MVKVLVADLVIHEREVEIPDQCPLCGAHLLEGPHAPTMLALKTVSQMFYAVASVGEGVAVYEHDQGSLWEHASDGTPLAFACLSCEKVLAEGESRLVKATGDLVTL